MIAIPASSQLRPNSTQAAKQRLVVVQASADVLKTFELTGATTQNLTVYLYANFYEYGRMGYGAAVATLLAVAIMVFTLLQWRFLGRRVFYR